MIDKGFSNGDMMEIDVDEVLHVISFKDLFFRIILVFLVYKDLVALITS